MPIDGARKRRVGARPRTRKLRDSREKVDCRVIEIGALSLLLMQEKANRSGKVQPAAVSRTEGKSVTPSLQHLVVLLLALSICLVWLGVPLEPHLPSRAIL
jgi:hypothetical protein